MTESEFYHEDIRELLDNSLCSDEGWMTVYSCFSNYDVDGIDKLERIWCYMVSPELAETSLQRYEPDITPEQRLFFSNTVILRPYKEGIESIVTAMTFHDSGINLSQLRINEEFIFFFHLFERIDNNGNHLYLRYDCGEEILVGVATKNSVKILHRYISEFIAAKRMDLMLIAHSIIDVDRTKIKLEFDYSLTSEGGDDISTDPHKKYNLSIWPCFTTLQTWFKGKYLVKHNTKLLEQSVLDNKHEDFIVGYDVALCDYIYRPCNDDNYAYQPIFFSRELINYYSSRSDCEVKPCEISGPFFTIRCDCDNSHYVTAFLKDLCGLPNKEQLIWKAFNRFPSKREFSDHFTATILGGLWNSSPKSLDFIFRFRYIELQRKWEHKYGWTLFKPMKGTWQNLVGRIKCLESDNSLLFSQLFDYVLLLTDESINAEAINRLYPQFKSDKPINKLHNFCQSEGISDTKADEFFHLLWDLRPILSSAHRPPSTLNKDQKRFIAWLNLNELMDNTKTAFETLLSKAICAFDELIEQL